MAPQSQNLVMVGLGIRGDIPPVSLQPPLPNGIHLRWLFKRDRDFPWHGYYLFRRIHPPPHYVCLGDILDQFSPGVLDTHMWETELGLVTSDRNITLTNRFPPDQRIDFDLAKREYLRFSLPENAPALCDVQVTAQRASRPVLWVFTCTFRSWVSSGMGRPTITAFPAE